MLMPTRPSVRPLSFQDSSDGSDDKSSFLLHPLGLTLASGGVNHAAVDAEDQCGEVDSPGYSFIVSRAQRHNCWHNICWGLRRLGYLACFSCFLMLLSTVHRRLFPAPGLPASASWAYFQHPSQRILSAPHEAPRYNDSFDPNSLNMTDQTCSALFPHFGYQADQSVLYYRNSRKFITSEYLDDVCNSTTFQRHAHIRAVIHNGQLYIRSYIDPGFTRGPTAVALLHQALSRRPEPVPDIELCFGLDDRPPRGTFGLDRPAQRRRWFSPDRATSLGEVWLLPDFGFLTWPEHVGPYRSFRSDVAAVEARTPWHKKVPRLVWRGSMHVGMREREAMRSVTDSYLSSWSDIREVDWDTGRNAVPMADHCKWRFALAPEGVAYTGRLRNLLNCRNVVVMHPPKWSTWWMHILDSDPSSSTQNVVYIPHLPWWRARLLPVLRGQLDWAQLPQVMDHLLSHDERAQLIARNQWDTLANRYLTPAAVACYWRRVIRAYSSVQDINVGLRGSDISFPRWLKTLPSSTQEALRAAMHGAQSTDAAR